MHARKKRYYMYQNKREIKKKPRRDIFYYSYIGQKNPLCDLVIIIGCSFYLYRNQFFRMIFGTMIVLGHIEFILDIVPLLYKFVPDENHVIIPMCLVFINLYFYHKCCMEDPGIITARTEDRYRGVYAYDGRMFKPGVTCVTCHLEKPARSKHCSKFLLIVMSQNHSSIGISNKNLNHLKVL